MPTRRMRTALAVVVLPLAVGVVGVVLARSWRGDLPDPVATHWGTHGADGFTSRGTATAVLGGVGAGAGILLGAVVWAAARRTAFLRRAAGGLASGLATFLTVVGVGSLAGQRGLSDAREAPGVEWVVVLAVAAGLAVGAFGAWVTPGAVPGQARAEQPIPESADRAPLVEGRPAAWVGTAASPPAVYLVIGVALLPLVILAVSGVATVVLLAVLVVVAPLVGSMTAFRVVVGETGLLVRSVLGWPRFRVPLEEVAEASVVEVRPLPDFGGWGLRGNFHGQFGVVLRAGAAIAVRRGDGSTFVVTIDGAEQAAALLNSLAERERQGRAGPRGGL